MKDVLFVFDAEDASRAAVVLQRAGAFCRPAILEMPGESHADLSNAVQRIEGAASSGIPAVFLIGSRPATMAGHTLAMAHRVPLGTPSVVIDISRIKTLKPDATTRPPGVPESVAFYFWLKDDGYANLEKWLAPAAVRPQAAPRSVNQFRCLEALGREQHFERAARACEVSASELVEAIRGLEKQYGHAILKPGPRFDGFTLQGEKVLAWTRAFSAECETLRQDLKARKGETAIAPLLERRSVSPKRLRAPGPSAADIDVILQAALRAPDHGGLHPWRVIEFRAEQRSALADKFEQEKLRRDPLASQTDRRLAREHATRAPALLAFVVAPRPRSKVPAREQWLAAGAALGNLLNAVHQLGFGAIMLSGERCFDSALTAQLGVRPEEFLAGFISLGTVSEAPPSKKHTLPAQVWSCWTPPAAQEAADIEPPFASTHTHLPSP